MAADASRSGSQVRLDGRTVLVTGSNTGIGRATALQLAYFGANVLVACRSASRAKGVLADLSKLPGHAEHVLLDLSDLGSVARCADAVIRRQEPLHVLVNNAAVAGHRGHTRQGFELAFGVNHLGHFLLTCLLLNLLRESGHARVVNVSSGMYRHAQGLDLDRVQQSTRSLTGLAEYRASKLCNVLFTQELARRVDHNEVTIHAVHPGVAATDIYRRVPRPLRRLITHSMMSPGQGALESVRTVTTPERGLFSGGYFSCGELRATSTAATPELAAELWRKSEQWTAPYGAPRFPRIT
jgi:retinol dehydrogenase 12